MFFDDDNEDDEEESRRFYKEIERLQQLSDSDSE